MVTNSLRLPQLQLTVDAEGGDDVLLGVVRQADHILLADLHHVVHLAGGHVEAVQAVVLRHGVHVVALRGDEAGGKVALLGHGGVRQRADNLKESKKEKLVPNYGF